ncbi:hypothetical protein [Janthinobacterium sp. CAN_S7]|uniref:hypothetical protein n=1 Tax=Janthinobacterium sp. CAN_S7 TaxID=3071704 RepID=UPI00319D980B
MKNIKMVLATISMVLLSGCADDKPSDVLTAEKVQPYAEQSLVKGLELTDFKRDNGWVDTESPNRYKVQYVFNYRLTKPLPEIALQGAQDFMAEYDASQKKNSGLIGGLNALNESMQLSITANEWIRNQGDQFAKRRDDFLSKCQPCVVYWNQSGSEQDVSARRYAFVMAWSNLERLGFKDEAKTGAKVPRTAWAAFIKTEKGWKAAS